MEWSSSQEELDGPLSSRRQLLRRSFPRLLLTVMTHLIKLQWKRLQNLLVELCPYSRVCDEGWDKIKAQPITKSYFSRSFELCNRRCAKPRLFVDNLRYYQLTIRRIHISAPKDLRANSRFDIVYTPLWLLWLLAILETAGLCKSCKVFAMTRSQTIFAQCSNRTERQVIWHWVSCHQGGKGMRQCN